MAQDNLKDFAVQWVFFGFLFFCLLSFAVVFVANNNAAAFGDSSSKFDSASLQSNLTGIPAETDSLLNISAESNPEVSDLGSRDSVAVSYGLKGTSTGFVQSTQMFMSWIFTGTVGDIIISVFVGMVGMLSLYFITKWIRQGV